VKPWRRRGRPHAFLDGDLQVAAALKSASFSSFVDVGIALADAIDHLVAFEDDAEAAALALLLEFRLCDMTMTFFGNCR